MIRILVTALMVLGLTLVSGQVHAKSPFHLQLLSWDEYGRLNSQERVAYIKDLRTILITLERAQKKYEMADNTDYGSLKEQIAQFLQMASVLPQAHAQTKPEDCGPNLVFYEDRCVSPEIRDRLMKGLGFPGAKATAEAAAKAKAQAAAKAEAAAKKKREREARQKIRSAVIDQTAAKVLKEQGDATIAAGNSGEVDKETAEALKRAGKITKKQGKDLEKAASKAIADGRKKAGLGNTWQNPDYFNPDGTAKVIEPKVGGAPAEAPAANGGQAKGSGSAWDQVTVKDQGPQTTVKASSGSAESVKEVKTAEALQAVTGGGEAAKEVKDIQEVKAIGVPATEVKEVAFPEKPEVEKPIVEKPTKPETAATGQKPEEKVAEAEKPEQQPLDEKECKVEKPAECKKPDEATKNAYRKQGKNLCIAGGAFSTYKSGKPEAGQCKALSHPACGSKMALCDPNLFCAAAVIDDSINKKFAKTLGIPTLKLKANILYPADGGGEPLKVLDMPVCAQWGEDFTQKCGEQLNQMINNKKYPKIGKHMNVREILPIKGKPTPKTINVAGAQVISCDPERRQFAILQMEVDEKDMSDAVKAKKAMAQKMKDTWNETKEKIGDMYSEMCEGDQKFQAMFCYECSVIRQKGAAWSQKIRGNACGTVAAKGSGQGSDDKSGTSR